MKRKSLKLMGLMLAAVLCFGGCGNEAASVDGSSESISSESTVESSTESAASSESDVKRESSEESESSVESVKRSVPNPSRQRRMIILHRSSSVWRLLWKAI